MAEPLRIAIVITELSDGGAARQCVRLVNELRDRSDVEVTFVRLRPGVWDGDLETAGVALHDFDVRSVFSPVTALRLRRLLRRRRIAVVLSWLVAADLNAFLATRCSPTRWVIAERDSDYPRNWRFHLRPRIGSRADGLISNSRAGQAYWAARGGVSGPAWAVPNIAPPITSRPRNPRADAPRVLFVGRLESQKNVQRLVDVFIRVGEQRPDVRFDIIGSGSLRPALDARLASHRGSNIEIHDFRMQVEDFFERADLFVTLSRHEGMPNVVLEAIAAGCALVASDIPAHRELLGDAFPNYVGPEADVDAIAQVVQRALERPNRGLEHATERLREMSGPAVAAAYVDALRQTASGG